MRLTLAGRIFLFLMLLAIAVSVAQSVATRVGFDRGFQDYVRAEEAERLGILANALASRYAIAGDWTWLESNQRAWERFVLDVIPPPESGPERRGAPAGRPPPRPDGTPRGRPPAAADDGRGSDPGARPPPAGKPRPGSPPRPITERIALLDAAGRTVAGPQSLDNATLRAQVVVAGVRVGTLTMQPVSTLRDPADIAFAASQSRSLGIAAIVALIIALGLAALLARQLAGPVRELTAATRDLRAGDFNRRVSLDRVDELGALARDFNSLAATLQHNRQERRRWVSDIAHELRTPLAVLGGELEALEDGIRPLDRNAIHSLADEVRRLSQLVDDLNQLARADSGAMEYRFEPLDLTALLRDVLEPLRARLEHDGIRLDAAIDAALVVVGDADRLHQVLTNLIENARRYTDAPGQLDIRAEQVPGGIRIRLDDTPPGIGDGDYERLFERLYRAEASRSRDTGGAGLGLAICRAIVAAHGGTITAAPSPAGGLRIELCLPDEPRQ